MTMNTGRDRSGRFAKGNPGGPGRPRQTAERLAIKILDAIEPHLKAAVEATIAKLIRSGAIPGGSAARVLAEVQEMPLWLKVGDPRRPKSIFYSPDEQCIAGLPPGEAVRRCRAAIAEGGFASYEELALSDHRDSWIARAILATIAEGRLRREARRAAGAPSEGA